MGISQNSKRYKPTDKSGDALVTERLKALSARWKRFGYRRLHVMLLREGFEINHKKTYRLYKDAGLTLQKRSKKKKYEKRGMPDRTAKEMNARWSMDFVSDRTRYGSNIHVLTVIDEVTRECLALEVDSSLSGRRVSAVLNRIALFRGLPKEILTDNGSEFAGKMLDKWVYKRGIRIDFSRPGTPTDNATVESFNDRLRQECLNENWFKSLEDARCKIEAWRIHYNQSRPHSALGWMTPSEFAEKSAGCQNMQPE